MINFIFIKNSSNKIFYSISILCILIAYLIIKIKIIFFDNFVYCIFNKCLILIKQYLKIFNIIILTNTL